MTLFEEYDSFTGKNNKKKWTILLELVSKYGAKGKTKQWAF
ncbi:hypothetical protein [Marinilactibacillus psychrotolerans]|uniref:Uncharacterized protein n=1 Tax=Marinilactibacillus psychrotolerans TaxID=191770 RepID=A0ABW8UGF8_9LACT